MSLRSTLKLPKEHGAWVMLYVPLAIGIVVAGVVSFRLLLLALSVTAVFISRESLLAWFRAKKRRDAQGGSLRLFIIYLATSSAAAAPLIIVDGLYWLAVMGFAVLLFLAFNAQQVVKREDRTIMAEVIAIIGLTSSAPAAHYVALGHLELRALLLWLLCVLFFTSSVLYIKSRVLSINARKIGEYKHARLRCAVYHALLAAAVAALALGGITNLFLLAAFAPVLARSFWHVARGQSILRLKRIGFIEIVNSLLFLIAIAITFQQSHQ